MYLNFAFSIMKTNLPEIVEVVRPVDPAVWGTLVMTIRLIYDVTDIRSLTVVKSTLEQLRVRHKQVLRTVTTLARVNITCSAVEHK